ncbi:glycosyl transferase family 1 [Bosea sp. AAP35]|uniref:glycosyltransferase family 4 protein n=1 Tax=Bosea sp. AAP35 TaxID=1523417 RepID=UPI0006B8B9C8|nr:glycosyltransferase family 4 protein [Bosea sp. AAP35]KPF67620.1 glycosyl transferase family 1 [Bosea sp. AAP35]
MRIGIIAHLKYPIREPFAGGLEMYTHFLARSLRTRGHEVTVFASTRSDASLGTEAICDETALDACGTDEADDEAFFREHHAYLSLMNDLRHRRFDIVHDNSLHYLPVTMADALPMPMVSTLHTPPFAWLESGVRLSRQNNVTYVPISRSVERAWSAITPVSAIISNGIDLQRFAFQPQPDASRYWIWYGRVVPEKGLHFAIDAAKLAGVPLKFAGPLCDRAYYDREIAPRLHDGVSYLGHLDHDHLAREIGGASAYLCTPCWEEPFGLVVAEALACGVPVAAFARGAIPEIIDAQSGVLARPDDPADLAAAGLAAQTLSRIACRRRAEQRCDAEMMIDGYEELYRRLASHPRATAITQFKSTARRLTPLIQPSPIQVPAAPSPPLSSEITAR